MFQGNWTCSQCGGAITELPFEPRSNSGLTCRTCYMKSKDGGQAPADGVGTGSSEEVPPMDPNQGSTASEPAPPPPDDLDGATPSTPGERKMFQGDWKCSGCGNLITQLPFEPRSTENLKCIDCFKKGKN